MSVPRANIMEIPVSTFRTAAYIDLDALAGNLAALQATLGPSREVLAVVKAEGYGHGAVESASAFYSAGASFLGVGTVEEGETLRDAICAEGGSDLSGARILVMSGAFPSVAGRIVERELEATVWDMEQVESLAAAARGIGGTVRVHLKVDSGMGRLGVSPAEAADFLRATRTIGGVEVAGLMSHLSRADEEEGENFTRAQFEAMSSLLERLREEGLLPPLVHCANSAGGLAFPEAPGRLVRVGLALYGCLPSTSPPLDLRPGMKWTSLVIQAKEISAGTPIGYGATYRRRSRGRIAVVGVGYADGYPRLLSNRAEVLVAGQRVPVVGRVSMDMLTVDVTEVERVRAGDEAVLLGEQGGQRMTAEELAGRAETIPYEILSGVSARVPRIFLRRGKMVGSRALGGNCLWTPSDGA